MKKVLFPILALVLALGLSLPMAASVATAYTGVSIEYGDVTLSGGFQAGHFPEVWDLTKCDLVLRFTYDANGLVDDFGGDAHAWAELGVRQVGYGDFNPTWQVEGAGVWLATDYDWAANTFDPDPPGSPTLDLDDKLILQKGGGCGEGGYWYWDGTKWALTGGYNLPSIPPNPGANHRVWWDRDGVDPWQNDETANTGGIYDIVITLHATSPTSGEAYMTINGLNQGFETDGNWNTIELTPAGMTFTGDMTQMQVFYGLYGYGATHSVAFNDITVTGCLATIVTLCAGQNIDVGTVRVWDDGTNLYVEYKTTGDWVMTETHLDIVTESASFPRTRKGDPVPGQFAYSDPHGPVTEYTYEVPLPIDGTLYVAAHAEVEKVNGIMEIMEETAWGAACPDGEGIRFVDKGNWATYFEFEY